MTTTATSTLLMSTYRVMQPLEILRETWLDFTSTSTSITTPTLARASDSMIWPMRTDQSMVWTPSSVDNHVYRQPSYDWGEPYRHAKIPTGHEIQVMEYRLPYGVDKTTTLQVLWKGKRYLVRCEDHNRALLPKGGIFHLPQTQNQDLVSGKLYRVNMDSSRYLSYNGTVESSSRAFMGKYTDSIANNRREVEYWVDDKASVMFLEHHYWEDPIADYSTVNNDGKFSYRLGGYMYKVIHGENIGWIGRHMWVKLEPLSDEEEMVEG